MLNANRKSKGNAFHSSRSPLLVFILVVFGAVALHYRHENIGLRKYFNEHIRQEIPVPAVQEVFPEASGIDYCESSESACRVKDASGGTIGHLLCSSPHCDDIKGYAGPVPLVVALDTVGIIQSIILLENNETGVFVSRLKNAGFFDNWNGLDPAQAAETTVDAVSGATMTSNAVIESLRRRCGMYTGLSIKRGGWMNGRQALVVFFMLPGLFSLLFPKRFRKLRPWILVSNVIVLGFATGTLFSLAQFRGWILYGPDLASQWPLIALVLVTIGFGLFSGKNLYCGYICPFGSAQELAGKINRAWHIRMPHWIHGPLGYSRTVVLAGIFAAAFIYANFDPSAAEPFSAFLFRSAPVSALILAGLFVLISVFRPRLWCVALCPTGRLLDIFRIHRRRK
jgi:hypothetical protein